MKFALQLFFDAAAIVAFVGFVGAIDFFIYLGTK